VPRTLYSGGAMNITIRSVQLRDAEVIAGIIREVGWFEHFEFRARSNHCRACPQYIALCLAADECHSAFVAEYEENKAIGYCSCALPSLLFLPGPEAYIQNFLFHLQPADRVVGTALLEHIIAEARKRGCARLSLINSRTRESYCANSMKNMAGGNARKYGPLFYL